MVWLGGPKRGSGVPGRRIVLHDPPPGYRPPSLSPKDRQRLLRDDRILMRVAAVVLVLAATGFMVIIFVIIATKL